MPALPRPPILIAALALDSKVHGTLIKNKDGKEIPPDEFIVFRPHDNAVPAMLAFYHRLLEVSMPIRFLDRRMCMRYRIAPWLLHRYSRYLVLSRRGVCS
jgi:hypothetical protein